MIYSHKVWFVFIKTIPVTWDLITHLRDLLSDKRQEKKCTLMLVHSYDVTHMSDVTSTFPWNFVSDNTVLHFFSYCFVRSKFFIAILDMICQHWNILFTCITEIEITTIVTVFMVFERTQLALRIIWPLTINNRNKGYKQMHK